jgi:hypothetical protein
VIHAAVDECVFWTFQEDTTDLSLSTWAQLLGLGALGGGAYVAVKGGSTGLATLLSASGGGFAFTSALQKVAPSPVQSSVSSVIQAGLSYYPLMQAKAMSGNIKSSEQKVAALSGLWDAAGAGCSTGVLKGQTFRTKHGNQHEQPGD